MRFVERFLVLLALIALGFRLLGSRDGPTLELIALPLLALFYLIASWFLIHERRQDKPLQPLTWQLVLLRGAGGTGMAYCIISLMLYTIGWLPHLDMLENCGIILALLSLVAYLRYRKTRHPSIGQFLLRIGTLAAVIAIAAVLPFHR